MPFTSLEDRRKINDQLKTIGFGGLEDTNLVQQLAFVIEGHDHLRNILKVVKPLERQIAYNALRPHLSFAAKPLDVYVSEMGQIAEREQLPTWDPETYYPKEFKVPEVRLEELAQEAIQQTAHEKAGGKLELVCTKCTLAGYFPAKNRKHAYDDARRAGWRWAERNGVMKTYCPKDAPGRLTMTLTCSKCEIVQRIRAWDEQDGYASARLRGWVIREGSTCPECAVAKLVLQ